VRALKESIVSHQYRDGRAQGPRSIRRAGPPIAQFRESRRASRAFRAGAGRGRSPSLRRSREAIERLERRARPARDDDGRGDAAPRRPLAASDTTATVATLVPPPARGGLARPAGPADRRRLGLAQRLQTGAALGPRAVYGVHRGSRPGDQVAGSRARREHPPPGTAAGSWSRAKGLIVTPLSDVHRATFHWPGFRGVSPRPGLFIVMSRLSRRTWMRTDADFLRGKKP